MANIDGETDFIFTRGRGVSPVASSRQGSIPLFSVPLRVQVEDFSARYEALAHYAFGASQLNQELAEKQVAQKLEKSTVKLKLWFGYIEELGMNGRLPLQGFSLLDALDGNAVSRFRLVMKDLIAKVMSVVVESEEDKPVFSDQKLIEACDSIVSTAGQIGRLQMDLVGELPSTRESFERTCYPTKEGVAILCFDGGGVRSYSSLLILKALMLKIGAFTSNIRDPLTRKYQTPCVSFDFVFGSSSGGLIAIMLARLRMTEQSCMDAFKKHAEDVFSQPRLPLNTFLPVAKYGDKALRKATDLIIESAIAQNPALKYHESKLISLETPLKNCQCAVFAFRQSESKDVLPKNLVHAFRSYDNRSDSDEFQCCSLCEIWEVVKATTAAPGIFPAAEVHDGTTRGTFLDGGLGANNPSVFALDEVTRLSPEEYKCLISIGSGHRSSNSESGAGNNKSRYWSSKRTAQELSRDTEEVHKEMSRIAKCGSDFAYSRFDVPGIDHIALDEWTSEMRGGGFSEKMHTLAFIEAKTQEYLAKPETQENLEKAARAVMKTRLVPVRDSLGNKHHHTE